MPWRPWSALVGLGPSRSQALAEVQRLDKGTTTRVVDALVRKGYVERLPDPDDARAVSLRVIADGRRLYERINSELIARQVDLIRDLDPEVCTAATEILKRLARHRRGRRGDRLGRSERLSPPRDCYAGIGECSIVQKGRSTIVASTAVRRTLIRFRRIANARTGQ